MKPMLAVKTRASFKIPEGYRELRRYETIRSGDRFLYAQRGSTEHRWIAQGYQRHADGRRAGNSIAEPYQYPDTHSLHVRKL